MTSGRVSFKKNYGEKRDYLSDKKFTIDLERYQKIQHSQTSVHHFYEKIFNLSKMLHTNTAKKIGKKREEFTKIFLKRFLSEWEGKE